MVLGLVFYFRFSFSTELSTIQLWKLRARISCRCLPNSGIWEIGQSWNFGLIIDVKPFLLYASLFQDIVFQSRFLWLLNNHHYNMLKRFSRGFHCPLGLRIHTCLRTMFIRTWGSNWPRIKNMLRISWGSNSWMKQKKKDFHARK